jgi:hypothetical protein
MRPGMNCSISRHDFAAGTEFRFLGIIRFVTSVRFLAGGVWALRAEGASIPCTLCGTCTVREICSFA